MNKFNERDKVKIVPFPRMRGYIDSCISNKRYLVKYLDKNGVIQTTDFREDELELIQQPASIPEEPQDPRRRRPRGGATVPKGSIWA